jgi:hypothetical protein
MGGGVLKQQERLLVEGTLNLLRRLSVVPFQMGGANDAAGNLELNLLAAFKTSLPADSHWRHEGRFVFDCDGHNK